MQTKNLLFALVVVLCGCGGGGTAGSSSRSLALCASRVQSIGTAMLAYTSDNDGVTPPAEGWMDSVHPYIPNETVYHCPSLKLNPQYGYAYNQSSSLTALSILSETPDPLVYESSNLTRSAFDDLSSMLATSRHEGKILVVKTDGTAQQVAVH